MLTQLAVYSYGECSGNIDTIFDFKSQGRRRQLHLLESLWKIHFLLNIVEIRWSIIINNPKIGRAYMYVRRQNEEKKKTNLTEMPMSGGTHEREDI